MLVVLCRGRGGLCLCSSLTEDSSLEACCWSALSRKLTAAKVKWFWKTWRQLSLWAGMSRHHKKTTNWIKANNAKPSDQGLEVFLWRNLEFYWDGEIQITTRRWLGSNEIVLFDGIALFPPFGTTSASFLWLWWPLRSRRDPDQQIHSPLWSSLWLLEPHLTFPWTICHRVYTKTQEVSLS